jgi:hypothetical protein
MLRRLLIPLLGSGLLLAVTAGSAFAKCEGPNPPAFCSEVVVSLPDSTGSFQAGTPETVLISVSQGEQPFVAMGVVLQFINAGDGSRLDVPATATNQAGLWRAVVKLPATGVWNTYAQVVTTTGADYRLFVERVRVAQPTAPAPGAKPVTAPPVAPTPPILPIALLLAGVAAAALAVQAVRSRRRSAAPEPTGSATAADRA